MELGAAATGSRHGEAHPLPFPWEPQCRERHEHLLLSDAGRAVELKRKQLILVVAAYRVAVELGVPEPLVDGALDVALIDDESRCHQFENGSIDFTSESSSWLGWRGLT
eukprot:2911918-Pyramimonas_sp.AAC.1